jgi:hypothetical protein
MDKEIVNKLKEQKIKKRKRKGLKVHSSPKLSEQLKGGLRKKIELSLMGHGLLLL